MSFENICWYLGNWSLYGLIGFGALALLIAALRKSWYWFTAIAICFAGVIGAEIWSFIHLGISISTQFGRWAAQDPMGWAFLACFDMAMFWLSVHLIAYRFKKKPVKNEVPPT